MPGSSEGGKVLKLHCSVASTNINPMIKKREGDLSINKKAYYQYLIEETFEAGIVLSGTEVKSLKDHGGSLDEGYVKIRDHELWLVNVYIAPYDFGNIYNHEPKRERKLLMHKEEINKLHMLVQQKGATLIPLALFLHHGYIKLKLGLAFGKKQHDKRQALKEKAEEREMRRLFKT